MSLNLTYAIITIIKTFTNLKYYSYVYSRKTSKNIKTGQKRTLHEKLLLKTKSRSMQIKSM